MRFTPVAVVLALAFVAAGCGARSSKPFTAKGTIDCLKNKGFRGVTSNASQIGLIAAFAENGGIKATAADGNTVTIAFAADDGDSLDSTEKAFKTHAPPALRPHISDVLRTNRNAVMVWTTTPSSDDDGAVQGCLKP
jgi:hypothetical protein